MDSGGTEPGFQLPHLKSEMWGTLVLNKPGEMWATRRVRGRFAEDTAALKVLWPRMRAEEFTCNLQSSPPAVRSAARAL